MRINNTFRTNYTMHIVDINTYHITRTKYVNKIIFKIIHLFNRKFIVYLILYVIDIEKNMIHKYT